MWIMVAEASTPDNAPIVYAICGLLGTVATGIVAIVVAQINANKKADEPPVVHEDGTVGSRLSVLEHRAEDSDERYDVLDKGFDSVTRWIYGQDPTWKP